MKTSKSTLIFKTAAAAFLAAAVSSKVSGQTFTTQPGVASIQPNQVQIEAGPILDVVPYVLSDGYTISMALIPSDTEFAGYDNQPTIPNVTGSLNVVQTPILLPRYTVRQVVTTVNVWDNQTVVLGGLVSSQIESTKDKVPVIGDVPLVGRLFQSGSKTTTKKNLMIFVTATIVDPSGLRVHSDDELPFAQSAIPPQPPGALQVIETKNEMHSAQPVNQ
jgi:general secretion pathway protein D